MFLPAGRVPALPPLWHPQGPAGRVEVPQQCRGNQGVQIHLPQQRGDCTSLSLCGAVAAVSTCLGPAVTITVLPARTGEGSEHELCPGTHIPSAGTPTRGAGSYLNCTANEFSPLVPPSQPSQHPLNLPCGSSSIVMGTRGPQPQLPSVPKLGDAEGKGWSWGGKAAQSRGLWSREGSGHPCSLPWRYTMPPASE